MKKVLFIDRDGTLIVEPPVDYQVDSLEKLEFVPGVFRNIYRIRHYLDYELVIVSNQDGMGTERYPYENFIGPHNKFLSAFKNEDIVFDDILIDSSMPEDNAPTRKPGTGLLDKYTDGSYDLGASFVIGDRLTDIELAANLQAKAIVLGSPDRASEIEEAGLSQYCVLIAETWDQIWEYLSAPPRLSEITRNTKETQISISLNLDGTGQAHISTGLGFFDHMLEQIPRHAGIDLELVTDGDLQVDEHHTVEDTALALGTAFLEALGNKKGIMRYGFLLPMDDSLAQVAVDFGGRNWLVWDVEFHREKIGDVPTELFVHFFKSFSDAAKCNLNIKAEGDNEHHKIEAIFKAFAKALKMAIRKDPYDNSLPSTKGVL
ncbi:MAG TPA: bifunctional histidinol-phosphatase/imidazoleglycerol-phosphate dehydratase HisB [Bacteroidales bacterium]|nr:bifunctional histidinol-phosphatase/imidazoleglycerol-phosphate dehydratase HisB [Bacteroidales bacterium]